jgi:hypothetical protein
MQAHVWSFARSTGFIRARSYFAHAAGIALLHIQFALDGKDLVPGRLAAARIGDCGDRPKTG